MTKSEGMETIESVQHLQLREISQPADSVLKIAVEEIIEANSKPHNSDPRSAAATRHSQLQPIPSRRAFELYWPTYVAYLVTQEPEGENGSGSEDGIYTGRILRLYSKSHFLEHIARDIGGHRGTVRHCRLVCLNRVVDVAAYVAPEVRVLSRPIEKKAPASRHIGGIIGPY